MSDEKPLNVRCAEAIGWIWVKHTDNAHSMHPGERYMSLHAPEKEWFQTAADGAEPIYDLAYDGVPPYGADTPDGWAVTGSLIERFKLDVFREFLYWSASDDSRFASMQEARGATACAAVAEWVAQFGAEAIKRESKA